MARGGRSFPLTPRLKRPDLGAVYFDNFSTSTYEAALSTYDFTHVVGTNTQRLLTVGVSIFATGSVSSITYGGVNLTKLRADVNGIYDSELWYLIAPASGSATITVTLNASLTSIAGAASWWHVDQTNPFSANAGGNGTNDPATVAVVCTTANNRIFGNLSVQTATGIQQNISGQEPHYTASGALGTQHGSERGCFTDIALHSLSWTGIGALDSWAVSIGAIQPPQPVSTTFLFRKTLSGIGSRTGSRQVHGWT